MNISNTMIGRTTKNAFSVQRSNSAFTKN